MTTTRERTYLASIVPLSSLKPHVRCPKCSSLNIRRLALDSQVTISNGSTLYRVTEECMMCGWAKTTEDVKLGV